jgi:hypothetical protein
MSNKTRIDEIASEWSGDFSNRLIQHVFDGYKLLMERDLLESSAQEREITQLLCIRIQQRVTGYEPYVLVHEPYEKETQLTPSAQPPTPDFAFVSTYKPKFVWAFEAKPLSNEADLKAYLDDLRNEFLTGRYSPFSKEGAMVGYLRSGNPEKVLLNIASKLGCIIRPGIVIPPAAHGKSEHVKSVPKGKSWPHTFCCHHLILPFLNLELYNSQNQSLE